MMSSMPTNLDSNALLETAHILARSVPTEALDGVCASLEYLHHTDREVSPDALRDVAPCDLSASAAEDIVFQLVVEGIMDETELNVGALRESFIGARLLTAQDDPPKNTVVATIPYDDPSLAPGMFEPLHGNILELIRSANDHLVLMSPFLSERAYKRLRPALHTAAANDADITLITNSLTYGETNYNQEFTSAVLGDERLTSQTTVYEYLNDETWTTFHAKIVIADEMRAYLGTANLTHRGLGDNLELGIIFRDNTVERLSTLVEMLRSSSFLHRVGESDNGFMRV
jgi:phosphatidylserine/phosphatidylglycerophosphate/cardiolipin synthase-like enzyme